MNGRLVPRDDLTAPQRDDMLALLDEHFAGVSRRQFARDLADKNWAILLHDDAGRLRGFTTLGLYTSHAAGRAVPVVCSGDTIVDGRARGSSALLRTWLSAVLALGRRLGGGPLHWLLITSGYRTYRFLPVFWNEFWPRFDRPTPPATRRLLDALAAERWGPAFDPGAGLVRFDRPQKLRCPDVDPGRLADPHVRFFLQRNPGHADGDELACLTRVDASNLTAAGMRMLRAARAAEATA